MIKLLSLLEQVVSQPKALFLAGPAGSGKTTVAKQLLNLKDFTIINVDDTYEELLKSSGLGMNQKDFDSEKLSKASQLMAQARKTTQDKYQSSSKEGNNLIIDGTGGAVKPLLKKKEELEKLGYKTFMLMTYVNPITSLERNKNRERSLLPSIILRTWKDVVSNINEYKSIFKDNMVLINTDNENLDKKFNPEEITKLYFDTAKFKGKEKTPDEQAKSDKEKQELNKNIEYLLQNKPEFNSIQDAKTKINKFLK